MTHLIPVRFFIEDDFKFSRKQVPLPFCNYLLKSILVICFNHYFVFFVNVGFLHDFYAKSFFRFKYRSSFYF